MGERPLNMFQHRVLLTRSELSKYQDESYTTHVVLMQDLYMRLTIICNSAFITRR